MGPIRSDASDVVLAARRLAKSFGRRRAVEDVSFEVRRGDVFLLVGADGAGKTTTLRMMLGLLVPTVGESEVLGRPSHPVDPRVFERVGYAPQEPGFRAGITVRDNLEIHRALLGLRDAALVDRVLAAVELEAHAGERVSAVGEDERRLLGVARALMHDPEVLVLDEPTRGLGRGPSAAVVDLVERLAIERQVTVLLCADVADAVLGPATHVGVMHDGRTVATLHRDDLRERGRTHLEIVVSDPGRTAILLEERLGIADFAVCQENLIRVYVPGDRAAEINTCLLDADVRVSHLSVNEESLEQLLERLAKSGAST